MIMFYTKMELVIVMGEQSIIVLVVTETFSPLFSLFIQALQEISVEERQQKLVNCKSELESVDKRIETANREFKSVEKKVQEALKKVSWVDYLIDKIIWVDMKCYKWKPLLVSEKITKHLCEIEN